MDYKCMYSVKRSGLQQWRVVCSSGSPGFQQQQREVKLFSLFLTFFFFFRKSRCVFSVGCCQGVNQNPTPDRRQNSCRLQINVGCNSTAICPRLQLLTASPTSQHPTSDSSSALIPDPRPCPLYVCVCVVSWERGWICVVTAWTDALIKYFSTLSCSCLSYWVHVKSADWKKTRFIYQKKFSHDWAVEVRSFYLTGHTNNLSERRVIPGSNI